MTEKTLKIGSTFMFGMAAFAFVMGLLWIFVTEIMFVSDFLHYTGGTFEDYLVSDPTYATFYIITKKLIGFMIVTVSIPAMFISHVGYSKREKWAWYALLITGGLLWCTLIGYRVYIGYTGGSMITFILGLVLWLIGLLVPIKDFFEKK